MNRKIAIAAACAGLSLASGTAFGAVTVETLTASYDSVFAKESTAVVFSAKTGPNPTAAAPRLSLVQSDANGKALRYIGILTDDGVMGDAHRGDGVYSRKIQVNEKQGGLIYYTVVEDVEGTTDPRDATRSIAGAPVATLEVIARPNLFEALAKVREKIAQNWH